MKKIIFLIILLTISSCGKNINNSEKQTNNLQKYIELEANFSGKDINDITNIKILDEYTNDFKSNKFYLTGNILKDFNNFTLDKNSSKCGLDINKCEILPKNFLGKFFAGGFYDFYDDGEKNIYSIFKKTDSGNYVVYKNKDLVFSGSLFEGTNGPIQRLGNINNMLTFEFKYKNNNDIVENIYLSGETINEKYNIDSSYNIFSYNNKIGFIGKKDGKKYIYFDGKIISDSFDELITQSCCAITKFPFEIYEDGNLFYLMKRGEKYYYVKVDLK